MAGWFRLTGGGARREGLLRPSPLATERVE
jgi:hypothetical protein